MTEYKHPGPETPEEIWEAKINTLEARIEKLKNVIYNYLEAGSNIALSTVKANLKSV